MKRISILLAIALIASLISGSALSEGGASMLLLPGSLREIGEEAFQGDPSVVSIVLPDQVDTVGERAFNGCSSLGQVTVSEGASVTLLPEAFSGCNKLRQFLVGSGADVTLTSDIFAGCSDFSIMISEGAQVHFEDDSLAGAQNITFYVHSGSDAELYALSHGYPTVSLDSESALDQARAMVAAYGVAPSLLQSEDPFETMRLLVRTDGSPLPDISAYNPVKIVRDGEDTYYIQFLSNVDTVDCFNALYDQVETVEPDMILPSNLNYYSDIPEEVEAATVTSAGIWGTEDPMGFDYYSDFVSDSDNTQIIAVIDSGIARGKGYDDLLLDDGINMASDGEIDEWYKVHNYHGSIIASVIQACAGRAKVRILPIRIEENTGSIDTILLAKSIDYAVDHNADFINLSLKLDQSSEIVTESIERAIEAGVKVVVAAGNTSRDVSGVYPACLPDVITVAGVAPGNRLSGASGYGQGVDYAAPSEGIQHTIYRLLSNGTSFAVPQIATAMALLEMDENHGEQDLNRVCEAIEGGGHGMPRLDKLAVVPTKSVRFDPALPTIMRTGEHVILSWEVRPENATDSSVTITSSDETVLRVTETQKGLELIPVAQGEANITLKANDGMSASAVAHVTVNEPVTSVTINGAPTSTWIGASPINLTAEIFPDNATQKSVLWSSTNTLVATVDQNGTVTPVNPGTTLIVCRAADGYGAQSTAWVKVTQYPDASEIVITDEASTESGIAYMGAQLQLRVIVTPDNALQKANWSIEPGTGSAEISDDGLVTPLSAGTVTVHAAAVSDNSVTATFGLTILPAPETVEVAVQPDILYPGETASATAAITPQNAYAPQLRWYSTNADVATVDAETGAVKAIGAGEASVYAIADTRICEGKAIPGGREITSGHVAVRVLPTPTVYFSANGGSVETTFKKVYNGKAVGTLPVPARVNYTFEGWYTSETGGSLYTQDTVCTREEDFTLYAHWKLDVFNVRFNANGGTVGTASITSVVNQPLGTLPVPTRDYYTFVGWYTESIDGTKVTDQTTYATASPVTVYAHWTQNGFMEWNSWTTMPCTPTANREVQTEVRDTYTYKTIYHYKRYRYWNRNYNKWYNTFTDVSGASFYGGDGHWQYWESETRLKATWNSEYRRYFYSGPTAYETGDWFDETTSQAVDQTIHTTWYRYRDRIR